MRRNFEFRDPKAPLDSYTVEDEHEQQDESAGLSNQGSFQVTMRLLTDTGSTVPQLQEFIGEDNLNLPPFAILSHTWEDDEVSLQDLSDPSKCINQRGFLKIKSTCNLAAQNGFKYTWIDTCCIDKQASAELSEAINPMFYWYEKAAVCYVYLSDLTAEDDAADTPNLESALKECRWFGRGWTLQELIAPANVRFYGRNWTYIGDKSTLSETISSITNIPADLLRRERQLSDFSVACRMSWASKRKTTRVEDIGLLLARHFRRESAADLWRARKGLLPVAAASPPGHWGSQHSRLGRPAPSHP